MLSRNNPGLCQLLYQCHVRICWINCLCHWWCTARQSIKYKIGKWDDGSFNHLKLLQFISYTCGSFSSNRQCLSSDHCLENKRKDYQNCVQRQAHSYEQFLELGLVGLGFRFLVCVLFLTRATLFLLRVVYVYLSLVVVSLVVCTNTVDCVEGLISDVTCYVSSGTLHFDHSITLMLVYLSFCVKYFHLFGQFANDLK